MLAGHQLEKKRSLQLHRGLSDDSGRIPTFYNGRIFRYADLKSR